MKVKMKDIAKEAGVSPSAVSLVLNNKPSRLAPSTKEKIKRIAREMAFQSDFSDLVDVEKAKTLGLILPDLQEPFYLILFMQIQKYAFSLGYTTFLCTTDDDLDRTCKAIESLATKNVDGILLVPPISVEHDDQLTKMLKMLVNGIIPLVLVDRAVYSVFCNFVTTDNKYGGKTAALHLAEMGIEKIGCLTGPSNVYTARKRLQGYQEGISAMKRESSNDCIFYGDYSRESGEAGAEALYNAGCRGIFVASASMTKGALDFVRKRGLRIPDDFAIIGYDYSADNVPCILQNVSLMAEKSVDLLIDQINDHSAAEKQPTGNFYITPTYFAGNPSTL